MARNRFGILTTLRRGFAISGKEHVSAWDLDRVSNLGYLKAPELAAPPPAAPAQPSSCPSHSGYGVGGVICTCNKVCTCIPICQAHELLNRDSAVQARLKSCYSRWGRAGLSYMEWAAGAAYPQLAFRIRSIMIHIAASRRGDPIRWPDRTTCLSRLGEGGVVSIMSAQWLCMLGTALPEKVGARVEFLLSEAERRPWQTLARIGYRARRAR